MRSKEETIRTLKRIDKEFISLLRKDTKFYWGMLICSVIVAIISIILLVSAICMSSLYFIVFIPLLVFSVYSTIQCIRDIKSNNNKIKDIQYEIDNNYFNFFKSLGK